MGESENAPRDEVRERLEAERGAPLALADQLKNCTAEINSTEGNKTFKDCREEALESMKRLRGKEVKPEEFEAELTRVAAEAAREVISRCQEGATGDEAKAACLESTEARDLAARLSGGRAPAGDELREAVRDGAQRDMAETVQLCRTNAQDDQAKQDCLNSDSFKDQVAESRGKARGEVKDSEVREFIEEGALQDVWSLMEACPEDKQSECLDTAKGMLADAMGVEKSEISEDRLQKALQEAMQKALGQRMRACVQAAEDDSAREQCKTVLVDEALNRTGQANPERGEREMALKDAGRNAAEEVARDCTGERDSCMQRLRERAAESMGRKPEEMGEMELERLNLEGAKDAAKDAARSCASARASDPSATCQDALSVFRQGRGKNMDESEERRVTQELAKDLEKEDMKVCLKEEDRTKFQECMGNVGDTDKVKDELFRGLSEDQKEAKKKRAKDEAAVDAVGEMFQACMEGASSDEHKKDCREKMEGRKDMAGLQEDVDDVIKKYQRNVVATAARVCEPSKRENCVMEAKDELVKMGLKPRAFGLVKQLADLKAAAETWAACQENSTGVNETCKTLAQATLEELSGSMEIWTEEVAAKVEELANAFLEGRDLVIRKLKQLAFEAITDLLNCSDGSFLDDLIDKVQNISDHFKNGTRPPRNITDKLCRVSWGSARFLCKIHTEDLPEEEMTELSDELAEELSTADLSVRRLAGLARRLAQVTETYVDQEVEETVSSTSSTTSSESDDSQTTSTSGQLATMSATVHLFDASWLTLMAALTFASAL